MSNNFNEQDVMAFSRGGLEKAVNDIAEERRRQISQEGWYPSHDDTHTSGEMAMAAATYAVSDKIVDAVRDPYLALLWPWSMKFWKPKDRRRDLVRAGALIVAEIERLDRMEA